MSEERNLRILNPRNFVDPNNIMRITSINTSEDSRETILKRNPTYANMSYYSHHGVKYKDLASYLKKFRCKHCKIYGRMAAMANKQRHDIVEALLCTNCKVISPLNIPIDRNNLGNSMAVEHRPNLVGKASKFKMPISESQKLGISRLSKFNLSNHRNSKTYLLEDQYQSNSVGDSMLKSVNKHLSRYGLPAASSHTVIKKNVDKDDDDYRLMMQGKGIIKETVDYTQNDIKRRFATLF